MVFASLFLAYAGGLPGYLAGMAAFGMASALLSTSGAAVVGDVIGGRGGTAVAGYQMSSDAGSSSGPLVAGRLTDLYSFRVAYLVTAAVSALALVGSLLMPETRERSEPVSSREPAAATD
jgi:MFS family permease